jgi:dihydroflavonol-4-reductase
MRVLVTGGTGFLGYHLCNRLVGQGHQVTALHRKRSQTARIQALGVQCLPGDLGNMDALCRAVGGQDAVIHAAGAVEYWSKHVYLQNQINVIGTRNLARASRLEGVKRLLHVSSVCAIGIPRDRSHPADEEFAFNLEGTPLFYHISKKRGEEAVLDEVGKGLNAVIVNPSVIFGPNGPDYRGGEMIQKVAGQRVVPYFTGGLCAAHIKDVLDGLLATLERGRQGNRYILGGENISFREIVRRSLKAFQMRRLLVPLPPMVTGVLTTLMAPLGRIQNRMPRFNPALHYTSSRFQYYLSEKARAELAYAPQGFDAIIQDFLSYCRTPEMSVGSPEVAL